MSTQGQDTGSQNLSSIVLDAKDIDKVLGVDCSCLLPRPIKKEVTALLKKTGIRKRLLKGVKLTETGMFTVDVTDASGTQTLLPACTGPFGCPTADPYPGGPLSVSGSVSVTCNLQVTSSLQDSPADIPPAVLQQLQQLVASLLINCSGEMTDFQLTGVDAATGTWTQDASQNAVSIAIHWSGHPVFPVQVFTAGIVPSGNCFPCGSGADLGYGYTYTATSSQNPITFQVGCAGPSYDGDPSGFYPFTFQYVVQLDDAGGAQTNTAILSLTCNPPG
jgi:hypothetical protein